MIISVVNMKGGVGKTTMAVNLALGLAKYHDKKILLVDIDPQSNTTQYLMKPDDYETYLKDDYKCTVLDIFLTRTTNTVSTGSTSSTNLTEILPTKENSTIRVYDGGDSFLDFIPSRLELMEAETLVRGVENRLKMFLSTVEDSYDIIFLDCPPTMGIFTLSSFIASNAYIVPLKPDFLSSVGLPLINKAIKIFQQNFPIKMDYLGLIFTMVQVTNLMSDTMYTLRNEPTNKCFESILSHSTKIAETVEKKQSIFDLVDERYSSEMVNIVDEFVGRMKE